MNWRRGSDKLNRIKLLFVEYEGRLLRYCTRKVKGEVAREIVQETFLKLWQQSETLPEDHVVPWLYTVCRNHCLDVLRKDKTAKPVNFEDEEHLSNSNPDQDYEARQRRQLTQRLIKALPEREQEVIRLKFEENLSYQQISSITGLTVTHVGVLIHNTLLKLKDEYKRIEKSKEAL